jgi:hypothetical protein
MAEKPWSGSFFFAVLGVKLRRKMQIPSIIP